MASQRVLKLAIPILIVLLPKACAGIAIDTDALVVTYRRTRLVGEVCTH